MPGNLVTAGYSGRRQFLEDSWQCGWLLYSYSRIYAAIAANGGNSVMAGYLDNSYMVAGCYTWLQVIIPGYYS